MRKILPTLLFFIFTFYFSSSSWVLAQEIPAENHPDINPLKVRRYEKISGTLGLVDIGGHTDPQAPQLTTLISGVNYPPIASLYQVYDWNWETNNRGPLLSKWEATLIGLGNSAGQTVQVPYSGYDIGGGYQVVILYASTNSLTIHYGTEDSVASGYTIHLENLNVNPEVLLLYQKLDAEGRNELPAASGGYKLGTTTGGELRVAVRDTGEFMDPRSRKDWWYGNVAKPAPLPLSTTKVIKGAGSVKPKVFTPTRKVQTTDVAPSLADAVKFEQKGTLSTYQREREIVRAGFFEQFKDLSMPFARDLATYLAGPFLYQGNTVINNFLKLDRPDKAGVLAKLTSSDLQDIMRRDYWQKCKNGIYCSSQNVGTENCPTASSNECLIADGTEIQNLTPPPDPTGPADLSAWQKMWSSRWQQVPLISNPKTLVKNAVSMASCYSTDGTTVETKTPWVSALNDVSGFLADLLLPSETSVASISAKPGANDLASQKQVLAAQTCPYQFYAKIERTWVVGGRLNYGVRITHTAPGFIGDVMINPQLGIHYENVPPGSTGIYLQTDYPGASQFLPTYPEGTDPASITISIRVRWQADFQAKNGCQENMTLQGGGAPPVGPVVCVPPPLPKSKADGSQDAVEVSGHALLVGPSANLNCESWIPGPGGIGVICSNGQTERTLDDPVWAYVNYPFLNTIYENLASDKGIFQALFKPAVMVVSNWNWAGESGLNYCLKPVQNYAGVESLWAEDRFLNGGGLYPYQVDFKPKALCEAESTQNLKVYPEKIGGVKNAQEWVVKELSP